MPIDDINTVQPLHKIAIEWFNKPNKSGSSDRFVTKPATLRELHHTLVSCFCTKTESDGVYGFEIFNGEGDFEVYRSDTFKTVEERDYAHSEWRRITGAMVNDLDRLLDKHPATAEREKENDKTLTDHMDEIQVHLLKAHEISKKIDNTALVVKLKHTLDTWEDALSADHDHEIGKK